ncbi:hypothetical protein EDD11_009306 [Mortierella claussenii]|nr:hypothetical protein EDD11_009306 [Mortierella claussenii]
MQRRRDKDREFRTCSKTNLLPGLSCSEKHLLLASILLKNNYFANISWYGVQRISNITKDIDLDDMSLENGLKECLGRIPRRMATGQGLLKRALVTLKRCREDSHSDAQATTDNYAPCVSTPA